MNLPHFLNRDDAGEIRLRGHRIGLYHVINYYNDGFSAEMLACQFPTLSLAQIHEVIGFYLHNKAAVDAYVADCHETLNQQRRASHNPPPLSILRERLAALHGAEIG